MQKKLNFWNLIKKKLLVIPYKTIQAIYVLNSFVLAKKYEVIKFFKLNPQSNLIILETVGLIGRVKVGNLSLTESIISSIKIEGSLLMRFLMCNLTASGYFLVEEWFFFSHDNITMDLKGENSAFDGPCNFKEVTDCVCWNSIVNVPNDLPFDFFWDLVWN